MFFTDPAAAFANIRRALGPDGRLVMMVWQAHDRNEWDVAIRQSLGAPHAPAALDPAGPDPFSLADPPAVTEILELPDSWTSPSPMSTSPSTTARTWTPPSSGFVASPARAELSSSSSPLTPIARSGGCARRRRPPARRRCLVRLPCLDRHRGRADDERDVRCRSAAGELIAAAPLRQGTGRLRCTASFGDRHLFDELDGRVASCRRNGAT